MQSVNLLDKKQISSSKDIFSLTNSVDLDEMQEMQHYAAFYAAFHLCLHCLQKYTFRGFPKYKGFK